MKFALIVNDNLLKKRYHLAMEFQKKSTLQLALSAGRKRQSPYTGFVHYCYEDADSSDTVPLLENFYFTLALFRSKVSENMLEAKALLEKLLAFQVGDSFPLYLHQFPLCYSSQWGKKIYPILFWIQKEFCSILGEILNTKLEHALKTLPQPAPPQPPTDPQASPETWAEFMIEAQLYGLPLNPALEKWHLGLLTFLGDQKQEGYEPALSLFDLFCAELSSQFSKRILQDHPVHLRGAIIRKEEYSFPFEREIPFIQTHPFKILWGDENHLHSLILETKGEVERKRPLHNSGYPKKIGHFDSISNLRKPAYAELPIEGDRKSKDCKMTIFNGCPELCRGLRNVITLEKPPEEDEMEIAFFLDAHPSHNIFIREQKASSFQLGDEILIVSPLWHIVLSFELLEGEGLFFGHLFKGNRKGQVAKKRENQFASYDWKIALRTLRRGEKCKIGFQIEISNLMDERGAIHRNSHCMHPVIDIEGHSCDSCCKI